MSIRVNGKAIAGSSVSALKKYQPYNVYKKEDVVFQVSDGKLLYFISLVDNNGGNSLGNTDYWQKVELEATASDLSFQLFDIKLSDHILKDSEAYGWALQGTYVYKEAALNEHLGYPTFYERCLDEYNNSEVIDNLYSYNGTIVGSPTKEDGVISNLSDSNYMLIPTPSEFGKYEAQFKFKHTATSTVVRCVIGQYKTNMASLQIEINADSTLDWLYTTDGATWVTLGASSLVLDLDTWVWTKLVWDGSIITFYTSLNGEEWDEVASQECTALYWKEEQAIGYDVGANDATNITVDLNECYIKLDDELYWKGTTRYNTYKHEDGHRFYSIEDKQYIDSIFETYGTADFYGIDEINEKVLLPRLSNGVSFNPNYEVNASAPGVRRLAVRYQNGNEWYNWYSDGWIEQGNVTGSGTRNLSVAMKDTSYTIVASHYAGANRSNNQRVTSKTTTTVAFYCEDSVTWYVCGYANRAPYPEEFNVEAGSNVSNKLLYYCVGNTKADTSWITLTEQVNAGIKEVEDARVNALNEIDNNRESSMTAIDENRTTSMNEIDTNRINSVTEIDTLRTESIEEINTLTDESVIEIDTLRDESVDELTKLTDAGVNALNNATHDLTQTQITNCLLEVPQKIKYTLEDGVLTIKAGSQVIVPYGTERNVGKVGSIIVDENGITSNFSADNYLIINKYFTTAPTTSFEAFIKFTTPATFSSTDILYYCKGSWALQLTNGAPTFWLSDGTTFTKVIDTEGTILLEAEKTYYAKVVWDGLTYELSYSEDNESYTSIGTYASEVAPLSSASISIGLNNSSLILPFGGSIDINESYIKIDDVMFWNGQKRDLTLECPIGSSFIHENYKVSDLQTSYGQFFVWLELQNDITYSRETTDSSDRHIYINIGGSMNGAIHNVSGINLADCLGYDTSINEVHWYAADGIPNSHLSTLPLGLAQANGSTIFGTIKQVFNGVGYIGSHVWVDKGIKALIAKGRNADGTLNNLEFTNDILRSTSREVTGDMPLTIGNTRTITIGAGGYTESATPISTTSGYSMYLNTSENIFYVNNGTEWEASENFIVATLNMTSGVINSINPKQAFRAVNYSDLPFTGVAVYSAGTSSTASINRPAVVIENYRSGASWYRVWSDGWIEQGGKTGSLSGGGSVTVSFIKPFTTTTYGSVATTNRTSNSWSTACTHTFKTDSMTVLHVTNTSSATITWYAYGY